MSILKSEYIVDLHLHSKYSYATSNDLDLVGLYKGAKTKGIDVLGTADFTHPVWFKELSDKLEVQENGLYQLPKELTTIIDQDVPQACRKKRVYFIPTVEVSCIYLRHNRVRKVHLVIIMPTLPLAGKLNQKLRKIGNLRADGRPTLGMDSVELLKICLDISPDCLIIPAHIWTPWFGLFGSKSGFDSLEEAFGDMKSEIYAVETGLSSDPAMNRIVPDLNGITLVSNSDAHSAKKLGREATVLTGDISYQDIIEAIKTGDNRFVGTIEFFPQEGKYYGDGHRKCRVVFEDPHQTERLDEVCPLCGKPLTVGVLNRVHQLSGFKPQPVEVKKRVEYIVPLTEIIAQVVGVKSPDSKRVQTMYFDCLEKVVDEFSFLRTIPINQIISIDSSLARAVEAMRQGKVVIDPGYDGVFGNVHVNVKDERNHQLGLL